MSTHRSTVVTVLMIISLSWWNVISVYSQQWEHINSFRLYNCGTCNCILQNSVCNTRNGNSAAMSSSLPVVKCLCTCKQPTSNACNKYTTSDSDVTVLAEMDLGSCTPDSYDILCMGRNAVHVTPMDGNETIGNLVFARTIFNCTPTTGCWYCQSPHTQDICTGDSPGTTSSSVSSTPGPASNSSFVSTPNATSTSSHVSNASAATGTRNASNSTLPGLFTLPTSKPPNSTSNHQQDSNPTTKFQSNSSLTSVSFLYNYTQQTTNSSISSETVSEDTTAPISASTTPNTAESSNNKGNDQESTDTRAMIIILSILGANAILAVVVCIHILNRRRKVNVFYRRQLKAARAAKTASRTHMSFNHHNSSADNTQIKTFF